MPNSIKCLGDVESDQSGLTTIVQSSVDSLCDHSEEISCGSRGTKTILLIGKQTMRFKMGTNSIINDCLKYFADDGKKADRTVDQIVRMIGVRINGLLLYCKCTNASVILVSHFSPPMFLVAPV